MAGQVRIYNSVIKGVARMGANGIQRQVCRLVWCGGFLLLAAASAAWAQSADAPLVIPSDVEVRGRGWSQLTNVREMTEFTLTLLETCILTAFLAFHPVNLRQQSQARVTELRKGMFLFALIGMMTGFLVIHHGYLIGFVIFGIGSLFRFRMDSSSIPDTAQLVIVSLAGLAAGLDLPVMAMVGTLAAWVVIFLAGQTQAFKLDVKFEDTDNIQAAMTNLQDHLSQKGFRPFPWPRRNSSRRRNLC